MSRSHGSTKERHYGVSGTRQWPLKRSTHFGWALEDEEEFVKENRFREGYLKWSIVADAETGCPIGVRNSERPGVGVAFRDRRKVKLGSGANECRSWLSF